MDKFVEIKIRNLVEDRISTVFDRDLDEDALPLFDSEDLIIFLASTIIQILAQPFVADVYAKLKAIIVKKTNDEDISLTEEDADVIISESYNILIESGDVHESWTSNWKYEKRRAAKNNE